MNRDKYLHELIDYLLGEVEYHGDRAEYFMSQASLILQEVDNQPVDIEKKLAEAAGFLINASEHFEKMNLYREVKSRAEKMIPTGESD